MRTRSKGTPPSTESRSYTGRYVVYNSNGTLFSDNTYSGNVTDAKDSDLKTMYDDPHPGFFTRISKGELVISPMVSSWKRVSCPPGYSESGTQVGVAPYYRYGNVTGSGTRNYSYGYVSSLSLPALPVLNVLSDGQLALNAWSNVDAPKTEHIEDLLTWRQTLKSLRTGPLTYMKEVSDNVRERGITLGTAGAWLTYRNTILPTFGLVQDGFASLYTQGKKLNKDVRLRASAKSSDRYGVSNQVNRGYLSYPGLIYDVYREKSVEKRVVLYYKLKAPRSGFKEDWGLRFKDLPVGFWNVVRLSYIIDRVYDISSYLQAMTNILDPNIVYEGGCVTTCTKSLERYHCTRYDNGPGNWAGTISGAPYEVEEKTIVRTLANPPYSYLNPSNIDFRPKGLVSDVTKTMDLVALVVQSLKGLRH